MKFLICQNCEVAFDYMTTIPIVLNNNISAYRCPKCNHINYNDNVKGSLKYVEVHK